MIRIIAAVALLLGASQAIAQGMDEIDQRQYADWRAQRAGECFWYGIHCDGNRYYYYRRRSYQRTYYADRDPSRVYSYRYRIQEPVTVYGDRARPECLNLVRAVGDERQSLDRAKDAAIRAWGASVRFHHGEVFLDESNAVAARFTCSRSSVGDTLLGKIQENAGITYTRCQYEARPCRANREREK